RRERSVVRPASSQKKTPPGPCGPGGVYNSDGGPYGFLVSVPLSVTAPGPGREAAPSTRALLAFGMRNTDGSVHGAGVAAGSVPDGEPVWVIEVQFAVLPKHPIADCPEPVPCPGQKTPPAPVLWAVPVTSGLRSTPKSESAKLPSEPPGRQFLERPPGLT